VTGLHKISTLTIRTDSNKKLIIVLGIILALVAGLSPFFIPRIPTQSYITIFAAIAAVIVIVAILYDMQFGVLLLPLVGVVVPFTFRAGGTGSGIVACLLFAVGLIGLWVMKMFFLRKLVIHRSPLYLPLISFGVVAVLASLNGNVMLPPLVKVWDSFPRVQAGGITVLLVSVALPLVILNIIKSIRWVQWITYAFLAIAAIDVILTLILRQEPAGFRTGGLFATWVVALAIGQALFNEKLPIWARSPNQSPHYY
jgi:hypothetical protein